MTIDSSLFVRLYLWVSLSNFVSYFLCFVWNLWTFLIPCSCVYLFLFVVYACLFVCAPMFVCLANRHFNEKQTSTKFVWGVVWKSKVNLQDLFQCLLILFWSNLFKLFLCKADGQSVCMFVSSVCKFVSSVWKFVTSVCFACLFCLAETN